MSRDPTADPLAIRARSTPDRTALVEAASGERWRYDELDDAASLLAERLAGLGLAPGDHLGLLAHTSIESVRLVHAAWRRGLRLVPLNVEQPAAELERRAARCDLDAIVCTAETAELAASTAASIDRPVVAVGSNADGMRDDAAPVDVDVLDDVDPLAAVDPVPAEPSTWHSDDPALLLSTSGTTGEPKVVTLTMGNLLASATASAFRLGVLPTDRWLLCLPIYHMGGLAPVLRSALYGTTLVVLDGRGSFDADAVARATREHGVTGLSLVPTQLTRVLDGGAALAGSVRTVLLGGAPARRELIERCEREDVPVHPTYGLTETASQVATATPEQAFEHPGTVGQPLVGTEVTVVDDELAPRPAGETGEIVVAGPTVTPGYYDDPEATEAAFCEHGLRTGDVGRVDGQGRLWVTGRLDDRIVTGGENVQPGAVARVLGDHPAVAEAAVVGLDDPEWGQRVAALVVPEDGTGRAPVAARDADALLEHCRERLAGFEVPKTIGFADALPRTASGTVDREAVRRALED